MNIFLAASEIGGLLNWSALLSAFVGGFLAIFGTWSVFLYRQRQKRQNLKTALITEIELFGEPLEQALLRIYLARHREHSKMLLEKITTESDISRREICRLQEPQAPGGMPAPQTGMFSAPVFESNVGKIPSLATGRLLPRPLTRGNSVQKEAVQNIIQFYSSVETIQNHIPEALANKEDLSDYELKILYGYLRTAIEYRQMVLSLLTNKDVETDYDFMDRSVGYDPL